MLNIAIWQTEENGHSAVRRLLARQYRALTGDVMPPLATGMHGKPYLAGSGLHCSLAHTDGMAACALSDAPVGIDCERIRPLRAGVAERILAPQEMVQFEAAGWPEQMLFQFWTLKEAWTKYTGEGLQWRQRAFVFDLSGDLPRLEGSEACFAVRRVGQWMLAVCTTQPEIWQLSQYTGALPQEV